ncbi:fringe glycosyltransferase [Anopheles ziemanni]|uniref:fringe glycosyltransferase n=1 Tax=Anopheles coustani TaxID=139045 RepID=UPI00265A2C69|nr:fringe glycosyltransferase [Anopheles coustani]XP_058179024.1 fringe glycosyltransferase [Anopheles ziemanni]
MRCIRKKMSLVYTASYRYRRALQTMAAGLFLIYMALVLYQAVYGYGSDGADQDRPAGVAAAGGNLQDFQSLGAMILGGGGGGGVGGAGAFEPSAGRGASGAVISKRDNSVVPSGLRDADASDNEVDSRSGSLVRRNGPRPELGPTADPPNRIPVPPAVTGTPKPPTTELDDLLISVKTTKSYHDTRLEMIIKTWYQLGKEQTWFFTDTDDPHYQKLTNNHMVNTNCSQGHFRKALCCKMGKEFEFFLDSAKKWWCHFDDDNYVNIPRLVRMLDDYSPTQDWYLGKPSISSPLEIFLDNTKTSTEVNKKVTFWFATGGAGFCVSRALALRMMPVAASGKFVAIGDKIRFPDDVTMGFLIEHILKVPLTVIDAFHSHLEPMEFIRPETFHDQVSFSYARMRDEWNVVKVDGFDLKTDPKRIYSLHCYLYPFFSICPKSIRRR